MFRIEKSERESGTGTENLGVNKQILFNLSDLRFLCLSLSQSPSPSLSLCYSIPLSLTTNICLSIDSLFRTRAIARQFAKNIHPHHKQTESKKTLSHTLGRHWDDEISWEIGTNRSDYRGFKEWESRKVKD